MIKLRLYKDGAVENDPIYDTHIHRKRPDDIHTPWLFIDNGNLGEFYCLLYIYIFQIIYKKLLKIFLYIRERGEWALKLRECVRVGVVDEVGVVDVYGWVRKPSSSAAFTIGWEDADRVVPRENHTQWYLWASGSLRLFLQRGTFQILSGGVWDEQPVSWELGDSPWFICYLVGPVSSLAFSSDPLLHPGAPGKTSRPNLPREKPPVSCPGEGGRGGW